MDVSTEILQIYHCVKRGRVRPVISNNIHICLTTHEVSSATQLKFQSCIASRLTLDFSQALQPSVQASIRRFLLPPHAAPSRTQRSFVHQLSTAWNFFVYEFEGLQSIYELNYYNRERRVPRGNSISIIIAEKI